MEKLPNGGMLQMDEEDLEYTEMLIKSNIFQNEDVKNFNYTNPFFYCYFTIQL